GSPGSVDCVTFQAGGLRLASAGQDNTVRLWDLITGNEILALPIPAGPIRSVAFSPNGRRLACAGRQCPPRILEASAEESVVRSPWSVVSHQPRTMKKPWTTDH